MKVLQINCVYKKGSTGKIVEDIHSVLLSKGIKSVICYGRGVKINEPFVYKTSTELEAKLNNLKARFGGLQYGGCIFATNKLLGIIKKEKPDVVHLHCINGFFVNIYKLLDFLKNNDIPTILTLHAEFMHTGSCGHSYECNKWKTGCGHCPDLKNATYSRTFDQTARAWKKMKHAFDGFKKLEIVSVSPWLMERAKQSPITENFSHSVILNGINCDVFRPCGSGELRKKLNLENKYVIVHVTASFKSAAKGGQYIRDLAKRLGDKAVIVVIGSYEKAENLPGNIIDIGRVESREKLAEYYSMADLSVIAGKKETFAMPVAESLCCGTPVAGFKAGGPETISIPEYSGFAEYGNVDELEKIVRSFMSRKFNREEIAESAEKKYSGKRMAEEYTDVYIKMFEKGRHK